MRKLESKPLSWFKVLPQVRKEFSEEELRSLGESMKIKQLQPLVARSNGILTLGGRRFRAAELVGIKELDVIICDDELTETQLHVLQLMENIHRADLKDFEKSDTCEKIKELNPGMSNAELAKLLKLSEATVSKYLSVSRCEPEVREALRAGHIGITAVYEISRAKPSEQAGLLDLHRSGVSRDELARRNRKPKQPTAGSGTRRIVCPLSSGITITVAGKGLSLDAIIEALSDGQREARKAREQGIDAKTFGAVMKDKARSQVKALREADAS